MQKLKKKPEVNLVIQEMVATDFFIVRLDYDIIAKSGHLKGRPSRGRGLVTPRFWIAKEGFHGTASSLPRNDNFDQILVIKSHLGLGSVFTTWYLVSYILAYPLPYDYQT